MRRQDLLSLITPAPETILPSPGRGACTIKGYSDGNVSYVRGKSIIRVSLRDLFAAYAEFRGKEVTSRDLRDYAPQLFDSSARPAGHSCNCTFLFMVLTKLVLTDGILGEGKAYRPEESKLAIERPAKGQADHREGPPRLCRVHNRSLAHRGLL